MHGIYFSIGMILFLVGQSIRAIRWQLLLPADLNVAKHRLLYYVSIGSLINVFIPFHVGDLVRAGIFSKREKIQFSTSLSSVIYERLIDIAALFVISSLLFFINGELITISKWYLFIALSFVSLNILLYHHLFLRKVVYKIIKTFNIKAQIIMLDLIWACIVQISGVRLLTVRFIALTVLMWFFLCTSYLMFMKSFTSLDLIGAWNIFHGNPALGVLPEYLSNHSAHLIEIKALIIFITMPIIAAIIYSLITARQYDLKKKSSPFFFLSRSTSYSKYGVKWMFFGKDAYSNFLISHFSGARKIVSLVGVKGFDDCRIKKFLIGGSKAVTAVVDKQGELSVRKAIDLDGTPSLYAQYLWLENERRKGVLPVVEVMGWTNSIDYSYYEMPLIPGSLNMYEWIKITSEEKCEKVFSKILSVVNRYHIQESKAENSQNQLILYLQEKVISNCGLINNLLSEVININNFTICGVSYSISEWSFLYDINRLLEMIPSSPNVEIHGDLTIENIVMLPNEEWILIDPNPQSCYKSRHMDWAKLMQSLHMGYEAFNEQSISCDYSRTSVEFIYPEFPIYRRLYNVFINEMYLNFSSKDIVAIELHEIIHYIRLIPYKIAKDLNSGILFFSITCILIRQFSEKNLILQSSSVNKSLQQ